MSTTNTTRFRIGTLVAVIIGLCIFPSIAQPYYVEVAMIFFIWIILAQSYRLIVTIHDWQLYHIVLYGVGAYTSGMLAKNFGFPVFLAIPIGGVMASLFGVIITMILLRTTGWSFYIATFGLAELIRLSDLRGDLHMHTTATDGRNSLAEMVAAAASNSLRASRNSGGKQGRSRAAYTSSSVAPATYSAGSLPV